MFCHGRGEPGAQASGAGVDHGDGAERAVGQGDAPDFAFGQGEVGHAVVIVPADPAARTFHGRACFPGRAGGNFFIVTTAAESRLFLDRKHAERRARNLERWRAARADWEKIVGVIRDHYGPRRIWLWGSLGDPSKFDERSDIDIGVEGVTDAEAWFRLLGDAMQITSFPLDIVQMEKIEPEFREIIEMKGRVIYERK